MSSSLNKTAIFREYIGVKPSPELDDFPDIVKNVKEFHFILGIGTEDYKDGKGTGDFKITWDANIFSKERVLAIKNKYSNVKVILSFGGLGSEQPFNPSEEALWSNQAFDSIKKIIKDKYQINHTIIDGIDINYEYITPDSPDVFTSCIGELITKLKKDSDLLLNTFSISPSKLVGSHYELLYSKYQNEITWINYQFYLHRVSSKDDFVNLYKELLKKYPQSKLLPGVSTDPKYAGNLKREHFIEGIKELIKNDKAPLAGAFVWNANDSIVLPPGDKVPYFLETIIQQILCGGGVIKVPTYYADHIYHRRLHIYRSTASPYVTCWLYIYM